MQAKQIKKLYYSIGEVSDLTGLKTVRSSLLGNRISTFKAK